MKTDLAGAVSNAANELENPGSMTGYYAFVLREIAESVLMVRRGEATPEEFCAYYNIAKDEEPL